MARVGKDGWIKHSGAAACPAGGKWTILDIKYRSGSVHCGVDVSQWLPKEWKHTNHQDDIVSWRPSKLSGSEKFVIDNVDAFNSFEMPAAKYFDENPLAWRDRIREIDSEVERLEEERAALVQKLEYEGFALIKEKANPVEDVSDPKNWKLGDMLEIVGNSSDHGFDIGEIVVVSAEFDGYDLRCMHADRRDWWFVRPEDAKWHSRPSA